MTFIHSHWLIKVLRSFPTKEGKAIYRLIDTDIFMKLSGSGFFNIEARSVITYINNYWNKWTFHSISPEFQSVLID